MKNFYHMFANGDDAQNFILSEKDFVAAFNRVGVCAYLSGATVLAFDIETTHSHKLLYGTYEQCENFRNTYESKSRRYITATRGSLDNVCLNYELKLVDDRDYLLTVGTYIINQPTKDGRGVMPYDYLWGTGSLYFRGGKVVPLWCVNDDGTVSSPVMLKELSARQYDSILHTRERLPGGWLVSNGYLLPANYVDVKAYENIYGSHNRFRVFLSNSRDRESLVDRMMSSARGVAIEDIDARVLCRDKCLEMFGAADVRKFSSGQRLLLARSLRRSHNLSYRQLAALCRVPESEIRKYL